MFTLAPSGGQRGGGEGGETPEGPYPNPHQKGTRLPLQSRHLAHLAQESTDAADVHGEAPKCDELRGLEPDHFAMSPRTLVATVPVDRSRINRIGRTIPAAVPVNFTIFPAPSTIVMSPPLPVYMPANPLFPLELAPGSTVSTSAAVATTAASNADDEIPIDYITARPKRKVENPGTGRPASRASYAETRASTWSS